MSIDRLRVPMLVNNGGAAVATHYATTGGGCQPHFAAFWDAVSLRLATGVVGTVEASGDTLDESTGLLTGTWEFGTPDGFVGGGSSSYPSGVGAVITWNTAGIVRGRRVKGRTFVVPLDGSSYDASGTIASFTLDTLRTAAAALITDCAGAFVVWSRPVNGVGGSAHPVTSATVADKVATLRSRRT